ncbi:hypothetical protein IEQ34_014811 [Dendrobium chrysotoxum]|uniref:Uncharacterized protein n=1 Tax=Dendrobium chrysotoxum TaxID=161865 RepID=A0AAV7GN77_DENCH|nr:hypothetical protein IEQ34_014811 [Dendrobium chrysotoxum]
MLPLLPKCCRPSLHLHATVRFLYKSKLKWPSCCSFSAICAFFQLVLRCAACFTVKWPSFCSSTEVAKTAVFLPFLKYSGSWRFGAVFGFLASVDVVVAVVACSKRRKWCCCHLVFKPYKEYKVEVKGSLLM